MTTETSLQELALLVLGLWSEDLGLHSELIYAGALAPLVLALNAPWEPPAAVPKGHLYGSRALANIAIHSTYRALIIEAGALPSNIWGTGDYAPSAPTGADEVQSHAMPHAAPAGGVEGDEVD